MAESPPFVVVNFCIEETVAVMTVSNFENNPTPDLTQVTIDNSAKLGTQSLTSITTEGYNMKPIRKIHVHTIA